MTTQKSKTTVATFGAMKAEGKRISMLTCYDYTTARLIEESSVNAILVGDSLGNVMLGYPDTLAVTVDDMITYGAAVVRGVKNTMVVVDMPYELSGHDRRGRAQCGAYSQRNALQCR